MTFTGRREIFTSESDITQDNVLSVLNTAFSVHSANVTEMSYLYEYYKGNQPVFQREKTYNDFVLNKIVENRAFEIVNFKTGYLVGEPIQYISTDKSGDPNDQVVTLNDMMMASDMAAKNTALVEWQLITGTGYKFVLVADEDHTDIAPFEVSIPDPRQCFVVKRNDVKKTPLMGVYYAVDWAKATVFQCWTKDCVYEIVGNEIKKISPNPLKIIPLVEYPINNARIGVIELVICLLDAINELDSDRLDGVDQLIQSVLVLTNATVGDDENARTILQKGMLEITSSEGRTANVEFVSPELNQQQVQVLKQDLIQSVVEIVGMPSQGDGNTGDSSNNGAVILKNGWQSAEASAKAHEMMFTRSERETLRVVMRICRDSKETNIDIPIRNIAVKFTRRNYENLQAKAQVLTMLLGSNKVAPKLAFEHCGMFADAESAAQESADYVKRQEAKAVQKQNPDPGQKTVKEEVENENAA